MLGFDPEGTPARPGVACFRALIAFGVAVLALLSCMLLVAAFSCFPNGGFYSLVWLACFLFFLCRLVAWVKQSRRVSRWAGWGMFWCVVTVCVVALCSLLSWGGRG